MSYVLGLLALSYLIFVFLSESINPFIKARSFAERRTLNFGRAAALTSLFAGAIALTLLFLGMVEQRAALVTCLIIASVTIIPFALKYKKKASWQ